MNRVMGLMGLMTLTVLELHHIAVILAGFWSLLSFCLSTELRMEYLLAVVCMENSEQVSLCLL